MINRYTKSFYQALLLSLMVTLSLNDLRYYLYLYTLFLMYDLLLKYNPFYATSDNMKMMEAIVPYDEKRLKRNEFLLAIFIYISLCVNMLLSYYGRTNDLSATLNIEFILNVMIINSSVIIYPILFNLFKNKPNLSQFVLPLFLHMLMTIMLVNLNLYLSLINVSFALILMVILPFIDMFLSKPIKSENKNIRNTKSIFSLTSLRLEKSKDNYLSLLGSSIWISVYYFTMRSDIRVSIFLLPVLLLSLYKRYFKTLNIITILPIKKSKVISSFYLSSFLSMIGLVIAFTLISFITKESLEFIIHLIIYVFMLGFITLAIISHNTNDYLVIGIEIVIVAILYITFLILDLNNIYMLSINMILSFIALIYLFYLYKYEKIN